MSIWIVTTGNSDVQLTTDEHWVDLYNAAVEEEDSSILEVCEDLISAPTQDRATGLYPAPARALGLVYRAECLDEYYEDLTFPLLHTFIQGIKQRPSKIIVLLTDQTQIFTAKQKGYTDCPFWQDTVELRDILTRYLQDNLGTVPNFYCITPAPAQDEAQTAIAGADNWENMLKEVGKTLEQALSELGVNREDETVYVSHQAGTPAISSAVQFLTVSKFKNVKFLVSNQYCQGYSRVSSPQVIESSHYWRGLQIEKAKRLIKNGQPGAALEIIQDIPDIQTDIITQLQQLVNRFNIKADDPSRHGVSVDEFKPEHAIKRVRDALEFIEIFFRQGNYIQGVTLLAAAQETFLKAAIRDRLDKTMTAKIGNARVSDLVFWDKRGLCLQSRNEMEALTGCPVNPDSVSDKLQFPSPVRTSFKDHFNNGYRSGKCWELNLESLFNWLKQITGSRSQDYWNLLVWSCTRIREFDDDRRNQLMHNLRGVRELDVIHYLLGCPKITTAVGGPLNELQEEYQKYANMPSLNFQNVTEVYKKFVKDKFLDTLKSFGLWDDVSQKYTPLPKELEELAKALDV
ncbi:MAG: hypothetical protein KME26_13930 [Oscillatoria princeps RMCB-10]|jgi:hypothetical protein|nr:hypothetical protein [Oscillatoria princeps RMCB-10]